MFETVGSRVELPKLEERILELWRKKDTFRRSVDARKSGPRFTLYEGPPTANGSPGIHHVLSRVFKDIIPRYKAMKGFYTPRIGGWDTHGLPVELQVEKELGFSSKADIEDYGIAKFNARCRENVFRYVEEWNTLTERIGFWLDLEHAYITMENDYIESCWWTIKQLWDKGLIYQGHKVTPHCPRCGTSLSSHEVAQGYQDDVEDPSVYIKFRLVASSLVGAEIDEETARLLAEKPSYLLAWTTTPWTLPANTALAVAPDAEYAVVAVEDEYIIMAAARLGAVDLGGAPVVARLKGSRLTGLKYEPLFSPAEFSVPLTVMGKTDGGPAVTAGNKPLSYPVITGDFVTMDEGTGIVHTAPAYGEVDYAAGQENGLYFIHPVDLGGRMTGDYPFAGLFVKEADPLVVAELEKKNLLFRQETIRHTYPFCWRCDAPLLYYAKKTWYIKTTALKDRLIALNEEINWHPEHLKRGRFGDWLENNVDWAISRERYWGTPVPIWSCDSCGQQEAVGGLDELKGKPNAEVSSLVLDRLENKLDLHRPYIDEVTYDCPHCTSKMKRVPEVIDCWFDSGNMPIAQHHYPFENETLLSDGRFPADYICEAVDQTRGWFYSLHAIATLIFDRPSYRNVISLGHILDTKGNKMSKAKGNVVEPWALLNKYGADALRWYFFTATPPGNARRFSEKSVAGVTRQFLLTLWNVYSFFVTYANIDKFTPTGEKDGAAASELDRWIISELNSLIRDVDTGLANYDPTGAGRRIENFVGYLSKWYVRRSRRRFWKSESDADKLSAYRTLYGCLVTTAKLMAPFVPFMADEIYQNLVVSVFPDAPDSVHLADFPVADESLIDRQLSDDIRLAMRLSSLGRAARSQAGIKVRQPLAEVVVCLASSAEQDSLERVKDQVLEELNVKALRITGSDTGLDGPGFAVSAEAGYTVAISTVITPELAAEGLAREIVHRLQTMRRAADFNIADHITTYYTGDDYVKQVMADFAGYIERETLSRRLMEEAVPEGAFGEGFTLAGHEITLGVAKTP
ncbi:MAG: isoleucine--tRNA ligase [Dehalococcoidales bacterium]